MSKACLPLGSLPFASPETVSAELHVGVSWDLIRSPMPSGVKKKKAKDNLERREQRTEIQICFSQNSERKRSGEARAC